MSSFLESKELAPNSTISDYLELMKPGVMSLVVFTALVGMLLAPGTINPFIAIIVVICVAIGSGASGALNMWYDRDIDPLMTRTAERPIPSGRVAAYDALALGVLLSILSVSMLGLATNWIAGSLLAAAIAFYVFVYTIALKRRTPQNIVIGGAAGAFPPVIGWAAVTGEVSLFSVIMFAIIFLWTPPHFWALAICRAGEYAKVKVPMLPVVKGIPETKLQMLFYSLVLLAVSVMPALLGFSGLIYGISAFVLGATFSMMCYVNIHREGRGISGKIFAFSISYMFILFAAMAIDHFIG